jgi:hypothetical protein
LIKPLPGMQPVTDAIRALHYQPIYTVYLQYSADIRLSAPMLGLSRGVGQWVFDRGQLGGPAGLLAVVISAGGAHEALDHAALAQEIAEQLAATLHLTTLPAWHQVIAEKRATFSCTPGLARPHSATPPICIWPGTTWKGITRPQSRARYEVEYNARALS